MDSSESSIKTWLKFFMDASIPAGVATEYAVSFSDNRMRLDMLSELTKDYLRDLNITILGDVIAILKHAKCVSQQEYTARKLGDGGGRPAPPPSPPPPAKVAPPASAESPASRMVKRLVRKEPAPPPPPPAAEPACRLKRAADPVDDDEAGGVGQPTVTKRRLVASGRLGTPLSKPAGGGKKTVFDRLGSDSQVSSTTPDTTRFRVTGLSGAGAAERAPLYSDEPAAVTAAAPRQRVAFVSELRPSVRGLAYRGVLKNRGSAEKADTGRTPGPAASTLASDRERAAPSARSRVGQRPSSPGRAAAATAAARPPSGDVRRRLSRPPAAAAAGRTRLAPPAAAARAGARTRLGAGSSAGSVLNRLGTATR